jgi:hypothetical protein
MTLGFDKFIDIYALKRYEKGLSIEGTRCDPDFSNVIFISIARAKELGMSIKNNNLACFRCSKSTIFLHDGDIKGFLCPVCSRKNLDRECHGCRRRYGCDTCGGTPSKVVSIASKYGKLFLCAKDMCTMPFGYYVKNNKHICSCEQDIIHALEDQDKLPKDLCNILSEWVYDPPEAWKYWNPKSIRLADLSASDKNRCLPCQIDEKYIRISGHQCNINSEVCGCSHVLGKLIDDDTRDGHDGTDSEYSEDNNTASDSE